MYMYVIAYVFGGSGEIVELHLTEVVASGNRTSGVRHTSRVDVSVARILRPNSHDFLSKNATTRELLLFKETFQV